MKYFLDTEFIDDGHIIDLISIGIAAEDGRVFYAESAMYNELRACPWVIENVIKYLTGPGKMRSVIKREIVEFIGNDPKPEFWAYYDAYDWVCFCQLFGRMIDLPKNWPGYCMDVKALAVFFGNPKLPEQNTQKHNAANDAVWTKEAYEFLMKHIGLELDNV